MNAILRSTSLYKYFLYMQILDELGIRVLENER